MKKTEIKKIIPLVWIGVLALWWVWYWQSLLIDTNLYNAVQKIQEIHFWADVGSSVWFKNGLWTVLQIWWTVESDGNMKRKLGDVSNTTTANSSVIWWTGNKNLVDDNTNFILWWESNKIEWNSEDSVILWGKLNTESNAKDSVILASDHTNVMKSESAWIWVSTGTVNWQDSAAYAWENVNVSGNESLTFWSKIRVNNNNVFVYNSKDSTLSTTDNNVFVVSADHGMIIGGDAYSDTGIQLTVHGAVRVWSNTCDDTKLGNIYTVQWANNVTCTCSCSKVKDWDLTVAQWVPLTDAGQCASYCANPNPQNPYEIEACWSRASELLSDGTWTWSYEADETTWRPFTNFCADGAVLQEKPNNISFPAKWSQTTWHCKNSWAAAVECKADRKNDLSEEAHCWIYGSWNTLDTVREYPAKQTGYWTIQKENFCSKWTPYKKVIMNWAIRPNGTQFQHVFPAKGESLSWYCKSESHWDVDIKCTAKRNPCSYCAAEWNNGGFEYCVDVNFRTVSFDPNCKEVE